MGQNQPTVTLFGSPPLLNIANQISKFNCPTNEAFIDRNKYNNQPVDSDMDGRNMSIIAICTLVQALRLCTGCTAHRGSKGTALSFHDHGTRRG